MPFNFNTFKTRAISAIVFAVIMLAGLLWNGVSFFILFVVIHTGCWLEYPKLITAITGEIISRWLLGIFMLAGFLIIYLLGFPGISIGGSITFWGFGMDVNFLFSLFFGVCGAIIIFQNNSINNNTKLWLAGGLLYISVPIALILFLRNSDSFYLSDNDDLVQKIVPISIIISIWINDTMAYIVGSFIGKTPFSPISPKKTWEGTIGGAILCVMVIGLSGYYLQLAQSLPVSYWIGLAAVSAIFGTIGDLWESKLKRMAGVKDSGHIMPGHGGFLDRFDSLLWAVPFVWLYTLLYFAFSQ